MRCLCVVLLLALGCGKLKPVKPTAPAPGPPKDSAAAGPLLVEVGDARVEGELLVVSLYLTTRESGTSVAFQSWQQSNSSARDDVGRSYKSREVPPAIAKDLKKILAKEGGKFELGSGLIVRHRPRVDVIAFERPAPIASGVVITLKADNIGMAGSPPIQLYLPSSQWTH